MSTSTRQFSCFPDVVRVCSSSRAEVKAEHDGAQNSLHSSPGRNRSRCHPAVRRRAVAELWLRQKRCSRPPPLALSEMVPPARLLHQGRVIERPGRVGFGHVVCVDRGGQSSTEGDGRGRGDDGLGRVPGDGGNAGRRERVDAQLDPRDTRHPRSLL